MQKRSSWTSPKCKVWAALGRRISIHKYIPGTTMESQQSYKLTSSSRFSNTTFARSYYNNLVHPSNWKFLWQTLLHSAWARILCWITSSLQLTEKTIVSRITHLYCSNCTILDGCSSIKLDLKRKHSIPQIRPQNTAPHWTVGSMTRLTWGSSSIMHAPIIYS